MAILVLVALGALSAGAWWLAHPSWFPAEGAEESMVTTAGRPVWASVTFPNVGISPVSLHVDTVTAHAVSDTSAATITPYVCTNRSQTGRGITAVGTGGTAMVRHLCGRLVPANDADMITGRGHPEYLILKIVAAHPGRLRLDRVDVTYRKGLQRGTQGIDFHLTVTAKPAL